MPYWGELKRVARESGIESPHSKSVLPCLTLGSRIRRKMSERVLVQHGGIGSVLKQIEHARERFVMELADESMVNAAFTLLVK